MHTMSRNIFIAGLAAFVLSGCTDATGSGDGTANLKVLLTDAPATHFESAVVVIGRVELVRQGGGPLVLTEAGGEFDLLELRNGITATLADLEVPPGRYLQLRMIVNSAEVTLAGDLEFAGGGITQALTIPSGAQSGLKVNLHGETGAGIVIGEGNNTLVVDFDVAQNFVIQGSIGTPAGIMGVIFTPKLRVVRGEEAGSISGTVVDATGTAVVGATVVATQSGATGLEAHQTAVATAVTDANGFYRIWFLAPGTYDVRVDGVNVAAQAVVVARSQNRAGVNFGGSP